jgi:hypothetical protein
MFFKKSLDKEFEKLEQRRLGLEEKEAKDTENQVNPDGDAAKDLSDERIAYERDQESYEDDKKKANDMIKIYDRDFWEYVREVAKDPSLMKRCKFKKRIFKALSTYGFHEGPLCDVLVSIDFLAYLFYNLLFFLPAARTTHEAPKGGLFYI